MDAMILDFVSKNPITILLILGVLKIIAHETPWATDDKIIKLITGLFNSKGK